MTGTPRTTDVVALALDRAERVVVGSVREAHEAVAGRVFSVVGGRVPESLHDAVATSFYGALSGVLRLSSGSVRALAARGVGRPVERGPRGRRVVAALNGVLGDELRLLDDPQAITMSLRHAGADVAATSWPLSRAWPTATGHVVLMVHGLCENEESWRVNAGRLGSTYADRVAAGTDGTPVALRYNTGLPVSENGRHLDALLQQLLGQWPVPVTRLTLVGHAMGALVLRAAANHATASQQVWPQLVRDVVSLGLPESGATAERAARLSAAVLPWGDAGEPVPVLRGRIGPSTWEGPDVLAHWGLDRTAASPLARADQHVVVVAPGTWPPHPLALLNHPVVGDLLVALITDRTRDPRALPAAAEHQE